MCGVFHHERPMSNNKYVKRRSTIPGGSLRVCTYKETASIRDCKIAITVTGGIATYLRIQQFTTEQFVYKKGSFGRQTANAAAVEVSQEVE